MPTIGPYISKINLINGTSINVGRNDIIVFVGANNCGKSTILNEINFAYAKSNKTGGNKIINKIEIDNDLGDEDFKSLIKNKSQERFDDQGNTRYDGIGYQIHGNAMESNFDNWKKQTEHYHKVFSSSLSTKERLVLMDRKNRKEDGKSPTEIYHIYGDDSKKFKKIKELFKDVFGTNLLYIPQYHDSKIYFKISNQNVLDLKYGEEGYDNAKQQYQKLGFIDEQGDGIKSFTGITTNLIAGEKNTYFIDEPESFLHPPQAYHLGQSIGELSEGQIFLATHSQDFIKGLLKSNSNRVKIYRIIRENNDCNLIEINKSDLSEIQQDPFLHYSNFLDSLFNYFTIICEDQSDCLFYNRLIDILLKEKNKENISINYVYTGGKGNFPKIYESAKNRGLNFFIIGDIDVLNDVNLLKNILGENSISVIHDDYEEFLGYINTLGSTSKTGKEIKDIINNEFGDEEEITKDCQYKLISIIKGLKKPWDKFKNSGKNIFGGNVPEYFTRIINFLEEKNIFLVPCGEMEDLIPEIELKKQKFVNQAIVLGENDEKLDHAKEFLGKIIDKM